MKFVGPKQASVAHTQYGVVFAYVEGVLLERWLTLLQHNCPDLDMADIEVKDCEAAHFDGGGMVAQGEPRARVEANGSVAETYLRQIDFIVPALRERTKEFVEVMGEYVWVRGRWKQSILALDTARQLADAFEREAEAREGEVDAAWDDVGKARELGVKTPSRAETQAKHLKPDAEAPDAS